MQAVVGREVTVHSHWQCADTFFFFDLPGFVSVGDLFGGFVAVEQKAYAVAHLGDWCLCAQVPHGCGEHIGACVKKRAEIVGFVAPVREVAAAGADSHALAIDVKEELVICGYVDVEMLRGLGELDRFSEVEDRGVFLGRVRGGDPLRAPASVLLCRGDRDECKDEKGRCFPEHAGDRTSESEVREGDFVARSWLRIPGCLCNKISLLKNGDT